MKTPNLTAYSLQQNHTSPTECYLLKTMAVSFGIPEAVIWLLISIATMSGNAVSIVTLIKSNRRRTRHSIYLISLLVSDFIIGASLHTLLAYLAASASRITCNMSRIERLMSHINIGNSACSLLSALAIAVDRFKALDVCSTRVLNNMQRNHTTSIQKPFIVVLCIWTFSLVPVIVMMVEGSTLDRLPLVFAVVFLAILYYYIRIWIKLRRIYKGNPMMNKNNMSYRKNVSSMRLIGLIILNTVVTWVPLAILKGLDKFKVPGSKTGLSIAYKIFFLSPLLDPMGYVLVRKFSGKV